MAHMTNLRIKYLVTMTVLLGIVGCQAPYYQQQGQQYPRRGRCAAEAGGRICWYRVGIARVPLQMICAEQR